MFGGYETTLNYQLPEEVLQKAMDEAIDLYLASHQKVFPIERKESSVKLKVQKSWSGNGEIVVISRQNKAFHIASKCIEESPQSILAWAKNWNNVTTLATSLKDTICELPRSIA